MFSDDEKYHFAPFQINEYCGLPAIACSAVKNATVSKPLMAIFSSVVLTFLTPSVFAAQAVRKIAAAINKNKKFVFNFILTSIIFLLNNILIACFDACLESVNNANRVPIRVANEKGIFKTECALREARAAARYKIE